MTHVFVSTQPDDAHAAAVLLVLAARGHRVTRWFGGDFPGRQSISVRVGDATAPSFAFEGPDLAHDGDGLDVVWHRRPVSPRVPRAELHPDDVAHAEAENHEFFHSMLAAFARDAVWINGIDAKRRASSKLLQLAEARAVGFAVPETLCSNDAAAIREFVGQAPPGQTIHKSFLPLQWGLADGIATSGTAIVTPQNLPSDRILRLTPGIFQRRIAKRHEVRATFFGDHAVAVAIDSQRHPDAHVDWRSVPACERPLAPIELPAEVHRKAALIMRRLDLLFGSFDFVVTPDGEYVFLEVNEAGQFLWKEDQCPELPLLDLCCEFLVAPSRDFRYREQQSRVRLADVAGSPEFAALRARDVAIHGEVTAPWRGPTPAVAPPSARIT
ncbi:MAG: hypothetical protein JNK45_32075 [Myxococcales bacterium]|nr:hypothetical protein [Myxococcales bacterium]